MPPPVMTPPPVLLALLVLLSPCLAHLTTICTSIAPSRCGEVTFYLGSFHDAYRGKHNITGSLVVTRPDGSTFAEAFSPEQECFSEAGTSGHRPCPAEDVGKNCHSRLSEDATVTCYTANPAGGTRVAPAANSCDAFPLQSGGYYNLSVRNFYVVVPHATAGVFQVTTDGAESAKGVLRYCGASGSIKRTPGSMYLPCNAGKPNVTDAWVNISREEDAPGPGTFDFEIPVPQCSPPTPAECPEGCVEATGIRSLTRRLLFAAAEDKPASEEDDVSEPADEEVVACPVGCVPVSRDLGALLLE